MTASSALSGTATLIRGVQGFAAGQYQAMVAKGNAKIAEENARRALEEGQIAKADNDMEISGVLGEQTAIQSASGLSLSSRSSQAVRRSTRLIGEMEGGRIMDATMREAKNFRQQKADFKAEAKAAKVSSYFDLAGGVVGAAAAALDTSGSSGGAGGSGARPPQTIVAKAQPTRMNERFGLRPKPYSRYLGSSRSIY